jgi:hypothetical protein
MDKPVTTLILILTTSFSSLHAQPAPDGEVRLPLSELRRLLAENKTENADEKPPAPVPPPALLSARLVISRETTQPQIEARFRVMSFGDQHAVTPLFQGHFSLLENDSQEPVLIRENNHTCLVTQNKGLHEFSLRLIPSSQESLTIRIPECASRIIECGTISEKEGVEIISGNDQRILKPGEHYALPMTNAEFQWKITRADQPVVVSSPPKPSTWTWRHEVLVLPHDDFLEHRSSSRASARDGEGAEARITLPRGAYNVLAEGPDLVKSTTTSTDAGTPVLHLTWKTRGILERRAEIRYRLSASPLDAEWTLQAPAGDQVRYLLASHPQLNYEAASLPPSVPPIGLPTAWAADLAGNPVHSFPAQGPATIRIAAKPVAETASGVIPEANWDIQIEPDGAMIATGILLISHKSPYDFTWQVPAGMELLSCEIDRTSTPPTQLGERRMSLHLPGASDTAKVVKLTFTGRTEALHPLEGTLDLALPVTPSFIAKLDWLIRLPDGYQAETSGNLTRIPVKSGASTVHLRKNLCRNEQPQARFFYQHNQAAR